MAASITPRSSRAWSVQRVTLGNAGVLTQLAIDPRLKRVAITTGASAVRVTDEGSDGATIGGHYKTIPTNTCYRIGVQTDVSGLKNLTELYPAKCWGWAFSCSRRARRHSISV